MRFIVSTESINCYGFRVLTSGIDLTGFAKNPVMLYMHDRYRYVPIGHWEDVRAENGQLTAEAVFDEADDFARTIKAKVDAGTLRACSPGLNIVEWSEDPALLAQGQTRPTVTKSTLLEISIVDIPGNADAVTLAAPQLHFEQQGVTLSAGAANLNLDFLPSLNQLQKMDKIALSLGLAATATQEDITAAIGKLKQDAAAEKVQLALKLAKEDGRVSEATEARFLKLATLDLDLALELFGKPAEAPAAPAAKPAAANLAAVLREVKAANGPTPTTLADKRQDWTIDDWSRKDSAGLLRLKREKPDEYQAMYNDYYGRKL